MAVMAIHDDMGILVEFPMRPRGKLAHGNQMGIRDGGRLRFPWLPHIEEAKLSRLVRAVRSSLIFWKSATVISSSIRDSEYIVAAAAGLALRVPSGKQEGVVQTGQDCKTVLAG